MLPSRHTKLKPGKNPKKIVGKGITKKLSARKAAMICNLNGLFELKTKERKFLEGTLQIEVTLKQNRK